MIQRHVLPILMVIDVIAGIIAAPTLAAAQGLTATERTMTAWVEDHSAEAERLLERVAAMNSGTMNFEGVREVGRVFEAELSALGFDTRWVPGAAFDRAGHLFADRDGDGPRLLLIGHLDTVFGPDSAFQDVSRVDGARMKGPGVADMKGGLVVVLHALKALDAAGVLDRMSLTVALMGDEERAGAPREVSRAELIAAANRSDFALGFEDGDGRPETAAVARRGGAGWTLRVTGTRGHSSQVFGEELGYGAIFEAARILVGFRTALAGEEYLTFNPGLVLGGSTLEHEPTQSQGLASGVSNVVAETALVTGDVRVISAEQSEMVRRRMREIVDQHLPGTEAEVTFGPVPTPMPPAEGNYRVLAVYDLASRDVGTGGVEAAHPAALGGADISYVASRVRGALDGLGMMGTGGHSLDEHADLAAMPGQTSRAAVLLLRLSQGPFDAVP